MMSSAVRALTLVSAIIYLLARVVAQNTTPPSHRPAELERLAFTLGTWDTRATCRLKPQSEPFEGKSVETIQWSPNGQFLISDQWGSFPQGWANKMVITTWDPKKQEYKLIDVTHGGPTYTMSMSFNGKTSHISGEFNDGGHLKQTWLSIDYLSDTEYKFRCESSIDHGPKWLFSEGTSTKRTR